MNLSKFFAILRNFIFCVSMVNSKTYPKTKDLTIADYIKIWQYCKSWEEGEL